MVKYMKFEALIQRYRKQGKRAAFVSEVPLLTDGAMEFKRKLGLYRRTGIQKKPYASGSYKPIPKKDYKRRIQKTDQKEKI